MNVSNGNVVHAQGLTKAYQGAKALGTLNLQVPKNSIFRFLGPNGAGKRTTIKMLMGLTQPTAGKVVLWGKNASKESLAIHKLSTPNSTLRWATYAQRTDILDISVRCFILVEEFSLISKLNQFYKRRIK